MEISYNLPLKNHNSFGIELYAEKCFTLNSVDDINRLLQESRDFLCLGGGSNILFKEKKISSLVLNRICGKQILEDAGEYVVLQIGAGENWHRAVLWCLDRDFGGIENLSLIPGSVGAAPIQNIGAYGAELMEVFQGLYATDIDTGEQKYFSKEDCQFAYRYSFFKGPGKGKYIISSIILRLTKNKHLVNTKYGALQKVLELRKIVNPSIKDISEAVIQIRQSKLPDPAVLGNAGSFFKNPIIEKTVFERLKTRYRDIKYYSADVGKIKIPAAWMIEKCGWKGHREGDAGVSPNHALVIVNYGNASGTQIYTLAKNIMQSVENKFGIRLEPEVNII